MESVWPVSKLSIKSVGSRRELVANSCTHRRRDATKQFRRVGVGGVYWHQTIIQAIIACACLLTRDRATMKCLDLRPSR